MSSKQLERRMRNRGWAVGAAIAVLIVGLSEVAVADPPMTGLKLWLKSDTGISGSPVSQWNDQSGQGNNASQSTANLQPSLPTATVGRLTNQPVVRFSGGTNALGFTLPGASAYTGMSVFYVASRGSVQTANETVFSSGVAASPGIRWALGLGSGPDGLGWGGDSSIAFGRASFAAADTFYLNFARTSALRSYFVNKHGVQVISCTTFPFNPTGYEGILQKR